MSSLATFVARVLRILVALGASNLSDFEESLVGSRAEQLVGDCVSLCYGLGFGDSVVSSLLIFAVHSVGFKSNLSDGSSSGAVSNVGRRAAEAAVDLPSFIDGLGSHDSVVRSLAIFAVVFVGTSSCDFDARECDEVSFVGSRAAESPIDDPVSLFDGRGSHDSVVSSFAISAELAVGRQGHLFDGTSGSFGSGSLFGSEDSGIGGSLLLNGEGFGYGPELEVDFISLGYCLSRIDGFVSCLLISGELPTMIGGLSHLYDHFSDSLCFGSSFLFGELDSAGSGVGSLSGSFSLSGSGSLSGELNSFLLFSFGHELAKDGMSFGYGLSRIDVGVS